MRQRYYNPEIKRFVNQDVVRGSMENSQSLNRYCYVQGNPVITGGFLVGAGFFTYCDGYEEMQSSWEQYFDNCLEQGKSPWQKDLTA